MTPLQHGKQYSTPDGIRWQASWHKIEGWFELDEIEPQTPHNAEWWIVYPSGRLGKLSGPSEWTIDDLISC